MKNRERFLNTLNFKPVDRLPVIEWAPWWDKTIERWKREGLPKSLVDEGEIREYFGLVRVRQWWIEGRKPKVDLLRKTKGYGKGIVSDMASYIQIKEHLYPEKVFNKEIEREMVKKWAIEQKREEMIIWIALEGFFWFPRTLFGIEEHLYAFYNKPEAMHSINQDLLEYNLRALGQFCEVCTPDFMTFAEDMSYNYGPMISKSLFDKFIAPYYKKIIPRLKEYGIIPFVDSDGNVESMISWFTDLGVEGFLPLEQQSGINILQVRRKNPELKMIGGYDKRVISKGEMETRAEFERILPVVRQKGYIPGVDHQTPPEVSLENYRIYLKLLKEYCYEAAQ